LVWGFVGLLLFMIGDGVESGYISPYLADHGAGSETRAAVAITVYGAVVTAGSWLSGALSDVWGPRQVMWLGLAVWGSLEVVFLAVALPTENYPLMLLAYGLRGFGYPFFAYGFLVWVLAGSPAHRLDSARLGRRVVLLRLHRRPAHPRLTPGQRQRTADRRIRDPAGLPRAGRHGRHHRADRNPSRAGRAEEEQ
jgi:MFS family permease